MHCTMSGREQKTAYAPTSPTSDWALDQAAIAAALLRFLRQPSRPIAPRPVAKSGRAAGSGVAAGLKNVETVERSPELSYISIIGGSIKSGASVQMTKKPLERADVTGVLNEKVMTSPLLERVADVGKFAGV